MQQLYTIPDNVYCVMPPSLLTRVGSQFTGGCIAGEHRKDPVHDGVGDDEDRPAPWCLPSQGLPATRPPAYASSAAVRGAGTGVCCTSPARSRYCHVVVPSCGVPAIRIGFAPARGTIVRSACCS